MLDTSLVLLFHIHDRNRNLNMKNTSWLLLSWIAVTHAATCYYPDGSISSNMTPCPDSQTCCGTAHACLTNGLCFGANLGVIYRGSCAKKSWPEVDCPNVCWGMSCPYPDWFLTAQIPCELLTGTFLFGFNRHSGFICKPLPMSRK